MRVERRVLQTKRGLDGWSEKQYGWTETIRWGFLRTAINGEDEFLEDEGKPLSFIHYLSLNSPLDFRCLYVTHATRALQNHDLSGDGINSGSHTHFFDHTRTWRPPQKMDQLNAGATFKTTRTWKMIHSINVTIHSNKANMKGWIPRPNDIRGPLWTLKLPDICLTDEEKPQETSPRILLSTGDRTMAHCVTGAQTTACSIAVDTFGNLRIKIVHRCGASGSMRACHAAGPGSIPGRERFPGWGFFPHL